MSVVTQQIQRLVELWARRRSPQPDDLAAAIELATALDGDTASPTCLRSAVWHLVRRLSANPPETGPDRAEPAVPSFPRCASAAASVRHGNMLLAEEVTHRLPSGQPILIAGELGASRAVFGDWETLPAAGALLVPLQPNGDSAGIDGLPRGILQAKGVGWRSVGANVALLEANAVATTLRSHDVFVPSAPLLALASAEHADSDPLCSIVFCASVHSVVADDGWDQLLQLARDNDLERELHAAVTHLRVADWLGVEVITSGAIARSIRRLFSPPKLRKYRPPPPPTH